MLPIKIVIIGAGSTSFAVSSLAALLGDKLLRGSTLVLVDIDAEALCLVQRLAERMNRDWDAGTVVEAVVDRLAALDGADFVVCAIETVPREELWKSDWEIPRRHGIRQPRAENGGPGGFVHAARNIPAVVDIARDMERLCPRALLIMLSNPLPRLCRAVTKYTSIDVVGLCHQIGFGFGLAGVALFDRTGVEVPSEILTPDPPPYPYGRAYWETVGRFLTDIARVVDITAAGLNHFTWMLDVRDRRTGEDFYPLLRERFLEFSDGPERLMRDMLQLTGFLPVAGDGHMSEFVPYVHASDSKPWERYGLQLYDWERARGGRTELWEEVQDLVNDGGPGLDRLRDLPSEGVREVVLGLSSNSHAYRPAVNVPNRGAIPGLPAETIVEVPGVVTGMGVLPFRVGSLPPLVSELCRREAELVEYVVDAAVHGSKEIALQALCLDPTVNDIDAARAVLDDFLSEYRVLLPQFHGHWRL